MKLFIYGFVCGRVHQKFNLHEISSFSDFNWVNIFTYSAMGLSS